MAKVFFPRVENNAHLTKLVEYFGEISAVPTSEIPPTCKFVFLCFTNRSGSNYLAELIASTGEFNIAGEDINFDTVINHSKAQGFKSFQQYFSYLLRIKMKNDVFFLKVAPSHIEVLGRAGVLDQVIDRSSFVLIERADKLAQAISFAIAFETGRFTSRIEGQREPAELAFSSEKITGILGAISESYKQFDLFFGRNGISPLLVNYERLVADPEGELREIARAVALPSLRAVPERVRIQRQAGATNAKWRELYLS